MSDMEGNPIGFSADDNRLNTEIKLLESRIKILESALELSATPEGVSHLVHPKCVCVGCQQREALDAAGKGK